MSTTQRLLTETEAGEILSLTPRQVLKLARRGEIPSVAVLAGELRFVERDLWTWVESRKQNGKGAK